MNAMQIKVASAVAATAVVALAAGYWFGHRSIDEAVAVNAAPDRKVLYWFDPMNPNQHFDKPGKSPYMDMQLVPKYADESGTSADGIRIETNVVQNMGVRLSTVERRAISQSIDAVGTIGFDQRRAAIVQARTNGFVARLYARAVGDVVERNAPLVDLLVPEWAGAQEEFLALLKSNDKELVNASRDRLELLGMPQDLIEQIEKEHRTQNTVTIRSPVGGAIEALEVREGMTVPAGATLAKINGLDTVWLEAAIAESMSRAAVVGKPVEAVLTAFPEQSFKGRIVAVLPEANAETRTLRVRIELKNEKMELRPGMFARVRIATEGTQSALVIASEAVIRTGTRNVVILVDDQGRFAPREIRIGGEVGDRTTVLDGLNEGQKVVASGQFLIDSEANLKGVLSRFNSTPTDSPSAQSSHHASGKVESIERGRVVLSHDPIPSLNWPAMTMGFKIEDEALLRETKVGDRVGFMLEKRGNEFVVTAIHAEGSRP